MRGEAFCPAHVTGFFTAELENKESPELIGSLGAGFSMQEGVTTTVRARLKTKYDDSNFQLNINGYKSDNTQVSEFMINEFLNIVNYEYFIEVFHDIPIPVGYGLGCSGAVALSLGIALNQALGTKLSKTQVGQIAHNAEIKCRTGLGDVLASYHGGFEIRTKSGAPGIGAIQKIKTNSSDVIIICFSPISTKEFLNERLSSINGLGGKMVKELLKSKDCNEFQDMSIKFAKYVEVITPRMNEVINELHENGIKCGVALFGETIFSLISSDMENKVMKILQKYKEGIIIRSKIDNAGARLNQ
ncbi:MAG: Pantoate kinase, archaeal [Nitrosopumilales archaeon]|jgi:pantoate kinase|nr:MAG: Pantoate kinase, archaeal [Nitrosopumilales archaeon]